VTLKYAFRERGRLVTSICVVCVVYVNRYRQKYSRHKQDYMRSCQYGRPWLSNSCSRNSWLEFSSTPSPLPPQLCHPFPPPGGSQRKITSWHLHLKPVCSSGQTVWQWDDSLCVIISLINLCPAGPNTASFCFCQILQLGLDRA